MINRPIQDEELTALSAYPCTTCSGLCSGNNPAALRDEELTALSAYPCTTCSGLCSGNNPAALRDEG